MTDERKGRLVILSGPSCVGKSPLAKALAKFYPELRRTLQPLVLYNTRGPRPGEVDGVDYHPFPRANRDAKVKRTFRSFGCPWRSAGSGLARVVGVFGQRRRLL